MTLKVRLAIADLPLRRQVCAVLEDEPDIVILSKSAAGGEVAADLLIVDGDPEASDVCTLVGSMRHAQPRARAVVLMADPTAQAVQAVLAAGASAVVAKAQSMRELLGAIRVVEEGGSYICRNLLP